MGRDRQRGTMKSAAAEVLRVVEIFSLCVVGATAGLMWWKGYSLILGLCLGLFTNVFGLVVAVVTPRRPDATRVPVGERIRPCPYCGEPIRLRYQWCAACKRESKPVRWPRSADVTWVRELRPGLALTMAAAGGVHLALLLATTGPDGHRSFAVYWWGCLVLVGFTIIVGFVGGPGGRRLWPFAVATPLIIEVFVWHARHAATSNGYEGIGILFACFLGLLCVAFGARGQWLRGIVASHRGRRNLPVESIPS